MEKRTIRIRFTEKLLGSQPKDKDIYKNFIASKAPEPEAIEGEELDALVNEEKGMTGFPSDESGIFLYDYQIKGFLKEAGNTLKEAVKVANLKSKIDRYLFVFPRRIYLKAAADGVKERPMRAETARGPRVALASSEYVDAGTEIEFELRLLPHKELKWKIVEELLAYGELKGLGQWRNGSYGRFTVLPD